MIESALREGRGDSERRLAGMTSPPTSILRLADFGPA